MVQERSIVKQCFTAETQDRNEAIESKLKLLRGNFFGQTNHEVNAKKTPGLLRRMYEIWGKHRP